MKHGEDSQMFLVRLWPEAGVDGETEWHGKLQHVLTGQARTFRGCPDLIEALLEMLPAQPTADAGPAGAAERG